jgi:DNA-binding NarL/FixJ family response regulator
VIRVALADDQALIRAGFRALIESSDDLRVVGEASDGREVLAMLRTTAVDVVVMDIRMPGMDGLEATRQISSDHGLGGVRVLVLTTFELDQHVFEALRAGASGFLGKGVEPTELLDAIRTIAAGEMLMSPRAIQALIAHYMATPIEPTAVDATALEELTEREREIVGFVAQGLTNHDIAKKLFLSPLTVKTHVNRAMTKVGARDRAQLVVLVLTGSPPPAGAEGGDGFRGGRFGT